MHFYGMIYMRAAIPVEAGRAFTKYVCERCKSHLTTRRLTRLLSSIARSL